MTHEKSTRPSLGKLGEDMATQHLKSKGWSILERNWRYSRLGEIDLIAYDSETQCLHIVEVKARHKSATGSAIEAITPSKQAKLNQLAEIYLSNPPEIPINSISMDIIAINVSSKGELILDFVENAF